MAEVTPTQSDIASWPASRQLIDLSLPISEVLPTT